MAEAMREWIYCATDQQVDAEGTQQLLRDGHAVWCPPPGLRPWPRQHPAPGERLWLLHKVLDKSSPPLLLGTGLLKANPEERYNTHLVWTARDQDGLVEMAEGLGFLGGGGMSFLVLDDLKLPKKPEPVSLTDLDPRFNEATQAQRDALREVLKV